MLAVLDEEAPGEREGDRFVGGAQAGDRTHEVEHAAITLRRCTGWREKSRKERESDRLAAMRQRAAPFNGMRRRKADRLLEDARDDLQDILPKLNDAAEAAQRARQRQLRERAKELIPAHRGVVARIAVALEALTEALGEEADIRRECQTPEGLVPAVLPEMGFAGVGLPRDHTSPVSKWFKHARRAGFIKD